MKVIIPIEVSDEARVKLRAAMKRGGRATRDEVRAFVLRLFADAVQRIDAQPITRRKRTITEPGPGLIQARQAGLRLAAAAAAADDAVCTRCQHTKEEHGHMGYACPPPHRGIFTAEA